MVDTPTPPTSPPRPLIERIAFHEGRTSALSDVADTIKREFSNSRLLSNPALREPVTRLRLAIATLLTDEAEANALLAKEHAATKKPGAPNGRP